MYPRTNFQQNLITRGWVIDDWTTFPMPGPFIRGSFVRLVLSRPNCTIFRGHAPVIAASQICFRFPICCSLLTPGASNLTSHRLLCYNNGKQWPFYPHPLCKIRRSMDEMFESIFCYILKLQRFKGDCGQKSRPNLVCLIPRGMSMSEWIASLRCRPNPTLYFWWDAAWLSGRLEVGCKTKERDSSILDVLRHTSDGLITTNIVLRATEMPRTAVKGLRSQTVLLEEHHNFSCGCGCGINSLNETVMSVIGLMDAACRILRPLNTETLREHSSASRIVKLQWRAKQFTHWASLLQNGFYKFQFDHLTSSSFV